MHLSPFLNASFATLGRFLIGIVLLVAAIGKWLDRDRFARAVIHYQILPQPLAGAVAGALPWVEFILALLLIINWFTLLTALLTIGLLSLFTAAQLVTLVRGEQVDCHCFGSFDQEKIGLHTLLRNAILMLIALWVLAFNWGYSAPVSRSILIFKNQAANATFSVAEQAALFTIALAILGMYLLMHQARKMLTQAKE